MSDPTVQRRSVWVPAPALGVAWFLRLIALILAILPLAGASWPGHAFAWSWMLFVASFVV